MPTLFDDPVTYAIPFFLILIGIELWVNWKEQRELYDLKDSMANLAMGSGAVVIEIGMKVVLFLTLSFLHQFAIFDIGTQGWAWLLLFFCDDFSFYWHHRLSHEVRILWAAHVNHHSSEKFNLSVALRQSWTEKFYKNIFWLWLPILGFQPWMIMIMISISLIYQFWVHTQFVGKLGFLEWIFSTPSHHRVHHGRNPLYLDRNHGGVLIIWDRLFGTFQEELPEEPPVFGITENIHTYNPLKIAVHEFQSIGQELKQTMSFRQKLKLLLMPPGWSPEGDHRTAKVMRDKYFNEKI